MMWGGMNKYDDSTDSCSLFWQSFLGILLILTAIGVSSVAIFIMIINPIIMVCAYFLEGVFYLGSTSAFATALLWTIVVVIVLAVWLSYWFKNTNSGVIRQSYAAWKDKTCMAIDIE